jgi:hypothetical protein
MSGLISFEVEGGLKNRAFAAYFRSAGPMASQPVDVPDGWTVKGKSYIVLHNVAGMLAVYRIKTDGFLKRLRRIPKAITDQYQ